MIPNGKLRKPASARPGQAGSVALRFPGAGHPEGASLKDAAHDARVGLLALLVMAIPVMVTITLFS